MPGPPKPPGRLRMPAGRPAEPPRRGCGEGRRHDAIGVFQLDKGSKFGGGGRKLIATSAGADRPQVLSSVFFLSVCLLSRHPSRASLSLRREEERERESKKALSRCYPPLSAAPERLPLSIPTAPSPQRSKSHAEAAAGTTRGRPRCSPRCWPLRSRPPRCCARSCPCSLGSTASTPLPPAKKTKK